MSHSENKYFSNLAPYACSEDRSPGRIYDEAMPTYRNQYQRDRDRIIHSAAFRRLEYKTQVFVNHEGDLFRTRLTHSLEVAQIARSIARELGLHEDLAEGIALAHDLGHTPFGHAGQAALNESMKDYGGFEHNLQSLRVVDKLEEKYAQYPGLNLMYETREGILKHCSLKNAEQLGDIGKRFIEKKQPSLEAQLCDLSDETAYINHDVDDGLRYGLLKIEDMMEIELFHNQHEIVRGLYSDISKRRLIHEIIRRMISIMVVDLIDTSRSNIEAAKITSLEDVRCYGKPIISFSESIQKQKLVLKQFLRLRLYEHYRVHRMSSKAVNILQSLFDAFINNKKILPPEAIEHCDALALSNGKTGFARGIADYIAGMTDRYAIVEYERIFNPRQLSFVNITT